MNAPTFIKFCGMTDERDVDLACALGIQAVGFVLWPQSPRAVTPGRLRELVRVVHTGVTPVAVFVRPGADDIAAAVDAGVQVVQLHGCAETPTVAEGVPSWIAASLDDQLAAIDDSITLLLDAHDPERHGGTGRTIDWDAAAAVAARRRVLLAGGLTPANVAEAIRRVRPYGVDVASGIEQRPGVKDAGAMTAFVRAVREAEQ
jgi:phosphoribosylanthranilate isomerase